MTLMEASNILREGIYLGRKATEAEIAQAKLRLAEYAGGAG
jgi:hypothetical protein